MAIYDLDGLLDKYSDGFLILEFNHLFIASSIREEVWLLQRKKDLPLIDTIMQAAREFNIHEVSDDRDFETYSGGQNAILACLLMLAVIEDRKIHGLKLLLNNILDSVSEENRSKLVQKFEEIRPNLIQAGGGIAGGTLAFGAYKKIVKDEFRFQCSGVGCHVSGDRGQIVKTGS
jgi:hypothetical protein